jgi:hypothetical protein
MRNNAYRNSTGSAMQVAEDSEDDAEMYERDESLDRRGDVTDAEFAMPTVNPRRQETGLTVLDEVVRSPQEGHFDRPADAMDVEQEAEQQALRDGGRDMDEVQESQTTSSERNSEEIVANVIGGSQSQLVDEPNWDRTYLPEDSAMEPVEESPRSSQEDPSRNTANEDTRNAASPIEAGSQSQPNLIPQSPQSPSLRGRLIRVPSLTSPYLSSSATRQKRRSISRFGSALSDNEGGGVRSSGFFTTLLGRKRGTSISVNPGSPTNAQGEATEDGGARSSGGSAEGHNPNTGVGEKRKR